MEEALKNKYETELLLNKLLDYHRIQRIQNLKIWNISMKGVLIKIRKRGRQSKKFCKCQLFKNKQKSLTYTLSREPQL